MFIHHIARSPRLSVAGRMLAQRLLLVSGAVLLPAVVLGGVPDQSARVARPPVDVNAVSAAELETIRGIGPALAARIVASRDQGGKFRDADDLRQRVRGIGQANLQRMIAAGLQVSGPARIEPEQAAVRERVELIVGNAPRKTDARQQGRIEETRPFAPARASISR